MLIISSSCSVSSEAHCLVSLENVSVYFVSLFVISKQRRMSAETCNACANRIITSAPTLTFPFSILLIYGTDTSIISANCSCVILLIFRICRIRLPICFVFSPLTVLASFGKHTQYHIFFDISSENQKMCF